MSTTPSQPTGKRARILLVDDEPALLRSYARTLGTFGYEVETAENGMVAIEKFKAGEFDVVMSDLSMPGMDGMQLLRAVREHDLDVPVVLATGAPSLETAVTAVEYGALRYLVKPVDSALLKDVLAQAVQLRRMARLKREAMQIAGELDKQVGDRAGLEVRFDRALTALWMAYQPIVSWKTRKVYAYEALVRSKEPSIPHPGALFDAAERLDRLRDLGRAIRAITAQPMAQADADVLLFVNLHTGDLLDETLYGEELPLAQIASRVVLEITERSSLDAVKDVRQRIARLREMGFRIAIDDLGAGYAGLTAFAHLEPDVVKLDMTLVRGVDQSATKQKLIRSMSSLAKDMGISIVAEGVETPAERDALDELGCDFLQGFFFAKPAAPFPTVSWG